MLRPAREFCSVRLSCYCHSSGQERHTLSSQLDPVANGRVLVARARPRGPLMWTTLFGIAFVISFLSLFAAIAMDF